MFPVPTTMKAPADSRPTWRNCVLQVKVTNACDLDCKNCSVGVGFAKKLKKVFRMTPAQYRRALQSLKGFPGLIGMYGGNPCTHPQFEELCRILREEIPNREQRGLFSNRLFGHGKLCAETFNPAYANLNVHQSQDAWDEIKRDWPQAQPVPYGLTMRSTHGPIFGSMLDLGISEEDMWKRIGSCSINQNWSAEITVVNGELLAYFCEIAATMAELTGAAGAGMPVAPGWWALPMSAFEEQVRSSCTRCLVPLDARKIEDSGNDPEVYTEAWAPMFAAIGSRPLKQVREAAEISGGETATRYLPPKPDGGGSDGKHHQ